MKHFCDGGVNAKKFPRNGSVFRNKVNEFDIVSRCNSSGSKSSIDAISTFTINN
jgi:hypothetical protein